MNFGFSEEQEELRKMVKRFLDEKSPESEVRRLMATPEGYDPAVWRQMADELALQGLGIAEEFGGQGYGPVELYVVFEEMGANLFCSPYFSTVALAANAVAFVGSEADQATYLPGMASGETIATVALTDDTGDWNLNTTSTTAKKSGDGWVVTGVRNYVTDGNLASVIFVPATTDQGLSLFAVQGDASGVARESLPTMDQTRKQSRIELNDAPATLVGAEGAAMEGLETTMQVAVAALAAEQVGGAQRVLNNASSTRRTECSLVALLDRSKRSSTSARTCCLTSSRPSRPRTTRRGPRRNAMMNCPSPPAWRSRSVRKPIFTAPPRTSRFTVALVHLGAPRAPVLQARQEFRALPRRPRLPPRAAGPATGHLI